MLPSVLSSLYYMHSNPDAGSLRVRLPVRSPAADLSLVERLAKCANLAKTDQANAGQAYQVNGEWPELIEADAALRAGLSDPRALRSTLETMFRERIHTAIGANHSPRSLERRSLKGAVKRLLIRQGAHQDLRIWRAIVDQPNIADLAAPNIGSPWGVEIDGQLLYPGVCRAHYFACAIANLLGDGPGIVAEIGGGYGEFAYRLLKRRSNVKYICFDLPEVLIKASYFLMTAFPNKRVLLYDELAGRQLTPELISQFDIVLLPNFVLPSLTEADITINTRSLSEMTMETVNEYIRHICRFTRRYFLHENSNEAILSTGNHVEIPASQFPISRDFKRLSAQKSPWWAGAGSQGRYVEYLYERLTEQRRTPE